MARIDGIFSPVTATSAAAFLYHQMQWLQYSVLHYSVERSQIPCAGQATPKPFVCERGQQVMLSSRFSNSMQFPFILHSINVLAGAETIITGVSEAAVSSLPCELGTDEDFSFCFSFVVPKDSKLPVANAGTLVLLVSRTESPQEKIRFSLPLPEVSIVADVGLQLSVEHPAEAVVGCPFEAVLRVVNTSATQSVECELHIVHGPAASARPPAMSPSTPSPGPASTLPVVVPDAFIVAGRTFWRLSLPPGYSKCTVVRMTPLLSGLQTLPSIVILNPIDAVTGKPASTCMGAAGEVTRSVLVLPQATTSKHPM